ncbi:hypothetical protein QTP70_019990 [Hemibagrus guttatus]|uniref:Uncharacterized protein n=1 Tax=Hemibagrus guttatus TaxID=175788 RepID=A0AAE0UI84_9TELE|nr:hypothetical protein QTP70_019990 [Hemibagrus guttatus]
MLDFGKFLYDLSSWTARGLACAAGMLALTSVGYCAYRRLKRSSDPQAAELQAAHGSVVDDVEEAEVTEVTDSSFQLLCAEHDPQTSAVALVTEINIQLLSTSLDPQKSADILVTDPSFQLLCAEHDPQESAVALVCVCVRAHCIKVTDPSFQLLCAEHNPQASPVALVTDANIQLLSTSLDPQKSAVFLVSDPSFQLLCAEHDPQASPVALVTDANIQLLSTSLDPQKSADILFSHHLGRGELQSTWQNIQFRSFESRSSEFESLKIHRYFLCMVRGPEVQLWWFTTTKTCCNDLGSSIYTRCKDTFTRIQRVFGCVRELVSCQRTETIIHVPYEDCEQTIHRVSRWFLHLHVDDQVNTSHQEEEESFFTPQADSEFEEQRNDMELSPEEMEVPFISLQLKDSGITDLVLKLPAVREAFSRMLACIINKNILYVAGKKILMRLAAANKQDPFGVQQAYDDVIQFLREPSYQEMIEAELFDAELYHFNLLDLFFEHILFGYIINNLAPAALDGGFLQRLFVMNSKWDVDIWEPEAEELCLLLCCKLTMLLEELFSQPLELYSDPAALAIVVSRLVKEHVQEMLKAMGERV